jgi:hypothetical protein
MRQVAANTAKLGTNILVCSLFYKIGIVGGASAALLDQLRHSPTLCITVTCKKKRTAKLGTNYLVCILSYLSYKIGIAGGASAALLDQLRHSAPLCILHNSDLQEEKDGKAWNYCNFLVCILYYIY